MSLEGRVCSECNLFKEAKAFGFKKYKRKDGTEVLRMRSKCTSCRYRSEFLNKPEEVKIAKKKQFAQNRIRRIQSMTENELEAYKAKQKEWNKIWRERLPEKYLELRRQSRIKRRDEDIAYKRQRYAEKKEEINAKYRAYYLKTREERLAYCKQYNDLPETKERRKLYRKERRPEDRIIARQKISNLDANYVKLVIRRGTLLKHRHIPTSLVEAKRVQLMILRSLRNEKR